MHIQKETKINHIITAYPQTVHFFKNLHMSCSGCFAVSFETLEKGALMHGLEVSKLLRQLNHFINSLPSSTPINHNQK